MTTIEVGNRVIDNDPRYMVGPGVYRSGVVTDVAQYTVDVKWDQSGRTSTIQRNKIYPFGSKTRRNGYTVAS